MAQLDKKFKFSLLTASVVAVLSAHSSMALAQDAQAPAALEEEPEVIQVRGIRGSMQKSLLDKRAADQVVDAITATDIGKLPDTTIADSLQRITGVSINRSGGEGSSVSVRGLQQVATTLNGEQMLSAGSITTIQPNFDDIPSTMVNGLEVIKSAQAKTLNGGLAGVINLKTVRPLDLDEGWTVVGKAQASDGSMGDDTDTKLALFTGLNLNSDTAFSVNLSHDKTNLADYIVGSTGQDWGFNASETTSFVQDNVDANKNGSLDDVYYAFQGHQASNNYIERERTGINGSFQHNFNDNFSFTSDVFYTEMEEYQYLSGINISQDWSGVTGWFTPDEGGSTAHENGVINDDGVYEVIPGAYNTMQSGEFQSRRTMAHSETHYSEKEALNTNVQLDYDNGTNFTASVRWVHGEAREDWQKSTVDAYFNSGEQGSRYYLGEGGERLSPVNPWGYQGQWATDENGAEIVDSHYQIPVHLAYQNSNVAWTMPMMSVTEADGSVTQERLGSNVDRYSLTSTNLEGYYSDATLDAFRVDGSYEFDMDHLRSIDMGARYGEREISREGWYGVLPRTNEYGDAFLARWKDSEVGAPLTGESYIDPIAFTDELLAGKITQLNDFEGTSGIGSIYVVDPEKMKDPTKFHEEVYGEQNVEMLTSDNTYEMTEETTSAYVQVNLDGEIFDLGYSGNMGVRYVKTEFDIDQRESTSGTTYDVNGQTYIVGGGPGSPNPIGDIVNTTRDYDDYLPAINFALELTDDMKVRAAFNKTVTTHDAGNLAGGVTINRNKACQPYLNGNEVVFCATDANYGGNPNLDPYRSTNYDLSWEWYFDSSGIVSLGLFYMDVGSFIRQEQVMLPVPDSDGVVRGFDIDSGTFIGLTPTQTKVNGEGGSIKGVELGYQQAFDSLPGIWGGFGVTANYTYAPSDSDQVDYYGKELPMADNSEHTSNLALWYEQDGWQARIAHNYRSKKFISVRTSGAYQFARWEKPTNYIDASVSYDVNEHFTVMFQGTNLTEEVKEEYLQWEDLVDKRYLNERKLSLGVQYRM
ncbi:TonB-dependent receptor [Echinimonas agarilytica]|uniref:TonB-dependent receptor n=1 Tax=Echinimonas agarilytica TaxID=1215918 RepID=A0AA41W4N3_9GAMM|nr:TonB-dependent receptor [Echinimonas agarilytica]MCM2678695.1 TonB-dependent receptor [Echinimonas agarilytica]